MDTNNTLNTNNIPSNDTGLHVFLNKRWPIILGVTILIFIATIFIFSDNSSSNNLPIQIQPSTSISPKQNSPTLTKRFEDLNPTPNQSQNLELEKAINEAKQAAKEYDEMQTSLRTQYPWLRKLPLVGVNNEYYVYFDVSQNTFIARLYPKLTKNQTEVDIEIKQKLLEKGIPISDFQIRYVKVQ